MKVCIDCYGNKAEDPGFLSSAGEKSACLVDKQDSATYICFKNDVIPQPIHRIVESGNSTEILWGFGVWSDRENVVYDTELSKPKIVEM